MRQTINPLLIGAAATSFLLIPVIFSAILEGCQSTETAAKNHPSLSVSDRQSILVGNLRTGIYHRDSCKWAEEISLHSRSSIFDNYDAAGRGFRPCKTCWPELTLKQLYWRREYDPKDPTFPD